MADGGSANPTPPIRHLPSAIRHPPSAIAIDVAARRTVLISTLDSEAD
jgi:hypothetical protein